MFFDGSTFAGPVAPFSTDSAGITGSRSAAQSVSSSVPDRTTAQPGRCALILMKELRALSTLLRPDVSQVRDSNFQNKRADDSLLVL